MKICHLSDTHLDTHDFNLIVKLPYSDVYVFTGDTLTDVLGYSGVLTNFAKEKEESVHIQEEMLKTHNLREFFHIPNHKPVVCVRGNHDFIDIAPLFSGGPVTEIKNDWDQVRIEGVLFSGFRGVGPLCGFYSDEKDPLQWQDTFNNAPMDNHVIVSHTPPLGVLDGEYNGFGHYGCKEYTSYLSKRCYSDLEPKACLFGHVHNQYGVIKIRDTIYSNAAIGNNLHKKANIITI